MSGNFIFRTATAITLTAALVLSASALSASAEPTDITVRVLSKDAKFIGTSMGGVRVTIRDADTGELLASGLTHGGTGDTKRLMHTDAGRRSRLANDSAAKFSATIDLDAPRRIEVEAYGPLAQAQSAQRASSTQWVIPGKHVSGGDGWTLELPGFAVDVLAPPAHQSITGPTTVNVRANVVMMCGCPITPGGLWDANGYEVEAIVLRNGKQIGRMPMKYAGEPSQFAGDVEVTEPGMYEVVVYAHDPANGNTGLDRTTFNVATK
ncbi:hypothetical protein APY04_1547 [Hyphomicrobium sulfonivorans]|uniref:Uncharacterized protein n=1 Tax=Hyphomicrobium sulfonivorans TaxID=121290 RepID=A0A120CWJ2_HYPSL|nr:hypothetical protein [Hyphomicrobium sulfonivorans]KWT69464.1 hypothetical protein APY04_1547 [Hyphomicrobium sulfonivorans]